MAEALEPALPDETLDLVERVLKLACDRELMLATAESCTGGLLAALLTDVPGCSHIFERGFVVYSKEAKCDLLALEEDVVDKCGAVSQRVAVDMARGALLASRAQVALAITGFAGPGDGDDEEGLVHFGCAREGFAVTHRAEHFGPVGRAEIRRGAVAVALEMLEDALSR